MATRGALDRLADWWYRSSRDQVGVNPETGEFLPGSQHRQAELSRKTSRELEVELNITYKTLMSKSEALRAKSRQQIDKAQEWAKKQDRYQFKAYSDQSGDFAQMADNASAAAAQIVGGLTGLVQGELLKDFSKVADIGAVVSQKQGVDATQYQLTADKLIAQADQKLIYAEQVRDTGNAVAASVQLSPEEEALFNKAAGIVTQQQKTYQAAPPAKQPAVQVTQKVDALPQKRDREVLKQ